MSPVTYNRKPATFSSSDSSYTGPVSGIWGAVSYVPELLAGLLSVLGGLDYAYRASPFVMGPADPTVTLTGLDIAYRGSPFMAHVYT